MFLKIRSLSQEKREKNENKSKEMKRGKMNFWLCMKKQIYSTKWLKSGKNNCFFHLFLQLLSNKKTTIFFYETRKED